MKHIRSLDQAVNLHEFGSDSSSPMRTRSYSQTEPAGIHTMSSQIVNGSRAEDLASSGKWPCSSCGIADSCSSRETC